ncbi:pilus assembly PilX family protein [Parachitinimonas caeni]|uniref:Tfp pilus assembly protein PilX n=1 Tax=Parachitinimonas caeni TaxID=3031301 RepID=A0ABT7DV75_9NEIS|nr:hypothetical protein [Parachitinimonas caeni]MDK2122993.1 hypothetical protein [Parachitinimonas caeni]
MKPVTLLPRHQHGLVLFIALVVMVVMSLAGVALMKTVDNGNQVVGNFAFRQAAVSAADRGVERAFQWLVTNSTSINTMSSTGAYLNTRPDPDRNWFADSAWSTATVVPANSQSAQTDSLGNKVSYMIVRQCTLPGTPSRQTCMMNTVDPAGSASQCRDGEDCRSGSFTPEVTTKPLVYYAVYVRVQGPRNTVSVVQSLVGLPIS